MINKIPTALIVFIIVISIIALFILTFTPLIYHHHYLFENLYHSSHYLEYLNISMLIGVALTAFGVYSGFKFKTEETMYKLLNWVGLIGNFATLQFLIFLCYISWALRDAPIHGG